MVPNSISRQIVFVGSPGCGKSTLITNCANITNSPDDMLEDLPEDLPHVVTPILLQCVDDEQSVPMVLIDTSVGDVRGTKEQISEADMIIVMASLGKGSNLQDVNDYWIQDQLMSVAAEQPILLILNKIDLLTPEDREAVQNKWNALLEHQLWEKVCFVSSKTGEGIESMLENFSDVLISCAKHPRAVLIDKYNDSLKPNFVAALTRVFRCLDNTCQGVLEFADVKRWNEEILSTPFDTKGFNVILQKLNEISVDYVTHQGITLQGFLYMIHLMTRHKQWDKCWSTVRFFNYEYNLTIKPPWSLPRLRPDEVIELQPEAFFFLQELFDEYALQRNSHICRDEIKTIFSVLPKGEKALILDANVYCIFERENDALSLNGWLSYWVLTVAEQPEKTMQHLSYLINAKNLDTTNWFRICQPKSEESDKDVCDRNLVRALLIADRGAGKTTFARYLISDRRRDDKRSVRRQEEHRMFCNRVAHETRGGRPDDCEILGVPSSYRFLCLTEVQIDSFSNFARDNLLPVYDLIVLAYDVTNPQSFKSMVNVFTRIKEINLANIPMQVLALKANLTIKWSEEDYNNLTNAFSAKVEAMGLLPQEFVWLVPGDPENNIKLKELFKGLVDLGQNPVWGRVRPKPPIGKFTYIKRTFTLSLGLLAIYGIYIIFKKYAEKKIVVDTPEPVELIKPTPSMSVLSGLSGSKSKQLRP